jgi:hypothetical protein
VLSRRIGSHWIAALLVMPLCAVNGQQPDTTRRDTSRAAQPLSPVEVKEAATARRGSLREGFSDRKRLGLGKFMDSTELRGYDARRMDDVLRGVGIKIARFQELNARGQPSAIVEWRAASPVRGGPDGSSCWVSVILDGVTLYRAGTSATPPDFGRDFSVSSFEAIEFYRGLSQTPAELSARGADCGILVLWTRRG